MNLSKTLTGAGKALIQAGLIATLIVGLIASTAFAARGGGGGGKPSGGGNTGGGGSLAMVPLDGAANHGDQVTFTISTSNQYPVVSITCSQGGNVVYGASGPMYQPNLWDFDGVFTLSSLAWTGGAADCTASLKGTSNGKVVTLGSTSFQVAA